MVMVYLIGYPLATGDLPSTLMTLKLFRPDSSLTFMTVMEPGRLAMRSRAAEADSAVLGARMASPRKMRPVQYCLYCASVMWYTLWSRTWRSFVPAGGTINTTGKLLFQ